MADDSKRSSGGANVDPLGVIERAAKEIWESRGKPAGTTWKDFFSEAEELMLAGRSSRDLVRASDRPPSPLETIPASIWALRDQDYSPIASVIAHSIDTLLNEHESFCLAVLLMLNEIKLADQSPQHYSDDEISALLASLSAEYDPKFLEREGRANPFEIASEKRAAYWKEKIEGWRSDDPPLTFADRNTIDRLKDSLCRQPMMESIRILSNEKGPQ